MLSPLLSLIYTKDVAKATAPASSQMYAEDVVLDASGVACSDLVPQSSRQCRAQHITLRIEEWSRMLLRLRYSPSNPAVDNLPPPPPSDFCNEVALA